MEAGGEPQHRTQSEPLRRLVDLGECARQYDARYPTVVDEYWGRRRRDIAQPYPRRSLQVHSMVGRKEATTSGRCLGRSRIISY
jgi:hypothetical protein